MSFPSLSIQEWDFHKEQLDKAQRDEVIEAARTWKGIKTLKIGAFMEPAQMIQLFQEVCLLPSCLA